ncbi:MAG: VWA domain-containing protein, partial [Eubacterium sp.]
LDSNYESLVTLSLPSKEQKLATDVVFVLDKSTSADVIAEIIGKDKSDGSGKTPGLLDNLNSVVAENGAKINVGVVVFNKEANKACELTELNSENLPNIIAAVQKKVESGTNLHAGILAGTKMLDNDSSVDSSRKYMVVISDGITYIYNEDPTTRLSQQVDGPKDLGGYKGAVVWDIQHRDQDGHAFVPDNWQTYLNGIAPDAKNTDYDILYDSDAQTPYISFEERNEHASAVDKALYLSWQAYQNASEKYRTYAAIADANSNSAAYYPFGPSFMNFLSGGKVVDFSQIQNDILYLVGPKSSITDYIGYSENYNFDLVDPLTMVITVDDESGNAQKYNAEQIEENYFGFYKQADNSYAYEVTYTPGDKNKGEYLTWTTKVPISNFQHVSLTYKVKLVNPQTSAGTYGQLDLKGDGIVDGTNIAVDPTKALFTNNKTTLTPYDSSGKKGKEESFTSPSVEYSVSTTPVTPIDPVNPVIPDNPVTPVTPANPTTDDGTRTNPPTNPQTDNNQETIGEEQNEADSPAENNAGIKTVTSHAQNPKTAATNTAVSEETSNAPKTADETRIGTMLILFGGAAVLLAILLAVKKRENE